MIRITLSLLASLFLLSAFSQESVNWISLQEALDKNKTEPRKIIVDVYTDWCGWCKRMDQTTFANKEIAAYINKNYWAVKFDAEGMDTIIYKGETFTNTPPLPAQPGMRQRKSTHPLAVKLLNGRMSYPSLVYMDDSSEVIAPIGGYRDAKDIQPFLVYFVENLHKYVDLQKFTEDFATAFEKPKPEDSLKVNWISATEAFERCEKENKKVLVYFYTDWSVPSTMMTQLAFEDSVNVAYINEHFLPVRFNMVSTEEVKLNEYTFINQGKEHPYHDFGVSLLNGQMQAPAIVFLTPERQLITRTPGYFDNKGLEPILHYFYGDLQTSQKWESFRAGFKSQIK